MPGLGVGDEIGDAQGRGGLIKFDHDDAVAGFDDRLGKRQGEGCD